jgi:hypothetical protein
MRKTWLLVVGVILLVAVPAVAGPLYDGFRQQIPQIPSDMSIGLPLGRLSGNGGGGRGTNYWCT